MDLRVVNHVLTHSLDYQKPAEGRVFLGRILGDGEPPDVPFDGMLTIVDLQVCL